MSSKMIAILSIFASMCHALAFTAPMKRGPLSSLATLSLVQQAPPPVAFTVQTSDSISPTQSSPSNYLNDGISRFTNEDSFSSSSVKVSLVERIPPTKEEIAAKKRNFNILFWGGGFVAPFLATFFYFGFKFWER